MKEKITKILNKLTYKWYWESNNKIIFEGEVWTGEVNKNLEQEGIQYKWCYEKGKVVYYIISQELGVTK